MRARFLAILILIVLLVIPLGLYWYFFMSQTTLLTVRSFDKSTFELDISGTFDAEYLPLADRFLDM